MNLICKHDLDKNRAYLDQNPTRKKDFEIAFQKVKKAKTILTNPLERNQFDGNHVDDNLEQPEFEADDGNEEPFHWQNDQPNRKRQVWWETKVC